MNRTSLPITAILSAFAALAFTSAAPALSVAETDLPEIEVNRDISDLEPILRPAPDRDSTNTALVFTNPRTRGAAVRCVALNQNGHPIGRIVVRIPGNGVRLALVSDMVGGQDFIGSVRCRTSAPVIPSAFIVGSGLTDSKAQVVRSWDTNFIRFPLVATF